MSPTAVTKPVLPPLQTPRTASFPSEICSTPISACMSAVIKQEADLRTPITPPTAYTDFLKALTPILASPPPSALSRAISSDSDVSKDGMTSGSSTSSSASFSGKGFTDYRSPISLLPPTPVSATIGSRKPTPLQKLSIPTRHSPTFSPATATGPTPRTALSMASLPSALYSPFSPADWTAARMFDPTTPRSACSKPVTVREVVKRTFIYKRTTPNLEPAPRGKRRKTTSIASGERSRATSVSSAATTEEESKRMPPPPPMISIKESTPEEEEEDTEKIIMPKVEKTKEVEKTEEPINTTTTSASTVPAEARETLTKHES